MEQPDRASNLDASGFNNSHFTAHTAQPFDISTRGDSAAIYDNLSCACGCPDWIGDRRLKTDVGASSTQTPDKQREHRARCHVPFPLIQEAALESVG